MLLRCLLAVSCLVFVDHATASGTDATIIEGASGDAVVEATIDKIQTKCIFPDDKLFLRRIAYVETHDGQDPSTFREDYHGGIWKVDEHMFRETQQNTNLNNYKSLIDRHFNIEWSTTSWEDCRKSLVSALAARLFIEAKAGKNIPTKTDEQAIWWLTHYRRGANKADFIDGVKSLDEECPHRAIDLAFLLDGSSSVGKSNFEEMKTFTKESIKPFTILSNHTRVAVVSFSSRVYANFHLQNSFMDSKDEMQRRIGQIRYPGGGTNTARALDYVVRNVMTPGKNGARKKEVAKFVVVITDGYSNKPSQTKDMAKKAHDADLTMFAVGVKRASDSELSAIASEPMCLHKLHINDFDEMDGLAATINKRSCDAPLPMEPGTDMNGTLPAGEDRPCRLTVPKEGATIKMKVSKGSAAFYISKYTYPSPAFNDDCVKALPGLPGVMFVPFSSSADAEGTVFCSIAGDKENDTEIDTDVLPGDQDHCKSNLCPDGYRCIDNGSSYRCELIRYECSKNSPCTPENIGRNKLYFPHVDCRKFIQCDLFGVCHTQTCQAGLIWDYRANTCNRPSPSTQC